MATQQATPQPGTNHDTNKKKKPAGPPDERFWVRYSPNHEFPVSTLGSVMLHLLLYGAAAFLISTVFWPKDSTNPVRIDVVQPGGGGGNLEGVGNGPGNGVLPKDRTEEATKNNIQTDTPLVKKDDIPLPTPKMNQPQIDLANARVVPPDAGDLIKRMQALRKQIQDTKVGPVAGAGKGGPGSGGGKGRGTGTGTGDDKGPGSKLTPIERRLLRRVIKYDVGDGNLYRQELAGLGIILATPETRRDGTRVYRFYRDLN
ncbi:MAG TPA: hypothetical protein VFA18_18650, partial [Gemmataceae bacterium]|nr:hypothetical protein [Gemmataceae bacterium]